MEDKNQQYSYVYCLVTRQKFNRKTGDSKYKSHLIQRINMAIQRGNSELIISFYPAAEGLLDLFFYNS